MTSGGYFTLALVCLFAAVVPAALMTLYALDPAPWAKMVWLATLMVGGWSVLRGVTAWVDEEDD